MKAALLTLSKITCSGRRIVVMGDMLELGKWSEGLHRDIGIYIGDTRQTTDDRRQTTDGLHQDADIDVLVTVGQDAAFAASEAKVRGVKTFVCKDNDEALSVLNGLVKSGDIILIKGSRGMRMETIVEKLKPSSVSV
jgi:UDP-N-acetylmuramoyl-tripeptide--D-alanyl-D-alanine ligase